MADYMIDLNTYLEREERALVGRDNGRRLVTDLAARSVNLPLIERTQDRIVIKIPDRIVTMNRSFFLGAFAERVQALGRSGFLSRYVFEASEHMRDKIASHVDYALKESTQSEILNG